MTKQSSNNQGIIINGGTFTAASVTAGKSARAISYGTGTSASPSPSSPPPRSAEVAPIAPSPYHDTWDAFVSHASEDKDFVQPLVQALTARGLAIWYDSSTLRIGNSLRESIDAGLIHSAFAIVILSPHYFAKSWTRLEINGLLSRESDGNRIVLPIWHGVTTSEVLRFSPILADRTAARSSENLQTIVDRLVQSIRKPA